MPSLFEKEELLKFIHVPFTIVLKDSYANDSARRVVIVPYNYKKMLFGPKIQGAFVGVDGDKERLYVLKGNKECLKSGRRG